MSTSIATLICVYARDSPEFFREALDSVLGQQLAPAFESRIYVGVDGPIQPELARVLDDYAPQLFLVYQAPINRGLATTLNELLHRLGDEEFLFRMDADDVSLPNRYQTQLDYLAAHPTIDILGTDITEFSAGKGEDRVVHFCVGPEDALASIHKRVPVAHPTVCFRRRVFRQIDGYPVVGTNEDIALWFECLRRELRFDNVPVSLLRFRISPNFWQRRSLSKARSELLCYLRGIRSIHGLATVRYLYPLGRFMMRVAPAFISKWAYRSSLRTGSRVREAKVLDA